MLMLSLGLCTLVPAPSLIPSSTTPSIVFVDDEIESEAPLRHFVCPASKLLDGSAMNNLKEELGEVEDLLIDPQSGEIEYAILARGGVLGMGEDLYAVPAQRLRAMETTDDDGDHDLYFQVNATVDQLESAPKIQKDAWPEINAAWEKSTLAHYGVEQAERTAAPERQLVRLTTLDGCGVNGTGDEKIGEINELVFDPTDGRIVYAVLGVGGFLGMGEKEFAVPYEMFTVRYDAEDEEWEATAPLSEERLENAPEFDKDEWAQMSNPTWIREVYVFYTLEPRWSQAREASYRKAHGDMTKEGDKMKQGVRSSEH